MEQNWEYIAGRNQASRQYHKQKRKEAEAELATLRAENERLQHTLEKVEQQLDYGQIDAAHQILIAAIAKEALK